MAYTDVAETVITYERIGACPARRPAAVSRRGEEIATVVVPHGPRESFEGT